MTELLLFFLLAISIPLFLLCRNRKQAHRRPPGPGGLPLIGNMHQFDTTAPHLYLFRLSKKYGPLVSIRLGSVDTLVVSSASAAKQVFKTHDLYFSSRPTLAGSYKLSYNGLDIVFTPFSDYWRDMRKICTLHLFNSNRSQSFRPIREDQVARMIKTISVSAAASNNIINLSQTLITLTSSIIYRITFGKIYDNDDEEEAAGKKFHWLLTETQALSGYFFVSDYFPLLGWIDRLSGAWGRLEKSFKEIDVFYQQLIDEHLRLYQNSGTPASTSILDILLQMKMDSSEFTFDHVKAILMNILVAASDTSAASVVWAMALLMKNPSKMEKVKQEARDLIGRKGFVDEEDVQKLIYMKAVVKETMRMYPAAPLLVPRETTEKCVVGGYEIEAKTLVFVSAYAIGRDPEAWENPDEFLPERFMNSSIDFRGQDFELIPFGAGRRICPGISMGVATTELALANLLYYFDWELPPGKKMEDIDMAALPGITMHKKNDLFLVPKII